MIIGEVPESLRLMIFYFFFRISESVKIGAHLLTLGSVKFIGQSWWSSGVISQTSSTLQFCCTYYGYRTLTLLYDVLRFKINVCLSLFYVYSSYSLLATCLYIYAKYLSTDYQWSNSFIYGSLNSKEYKSGIQNRSLI